MDDTYTCSMNDENVKTYCNVNEVMQYIKL